MVDLGSGTNDYVPFAHGVGANVETADDWKNNIVRSAGFQNGVALPSQANTAWRQASVIAAMIAQFSADFSAQASVDDGDVLAAEQRFIDALQAYAAPVGVYFVTDTGSANAIVGTSSNPPASYTAVKLVIFKKMAQDNSGPVTINLWSKGAVPLTDNTGAAFSSGALKGSAFYICAPDGGSSFRILGGATTYTNVTDLTANSGDGISVTAETGVVDRRRLRGTHDITVNSGDRWARGKASDDTDIYMTTTEFLAWLISQLNIPEIPETPPGPFGTDVGQCAIQMIYTKGWVINLPYAGITTGMTVSGSNLSSGQIPGANTWLWGAMAINGTNTGVLSVNYSPGAGVYGNNDAQLTGTWRLVAWTFSIAAANNAEWHHAVWQRIA